MIMTCGELVNPITYNTYKEQFMSENTNQPSVIKFEQAVATKDYENACNELLSILGKLDNNFGAINGIEIDYPTQINGLENHMVAHLCTRIAVATTTLFQDPKLNLSESGALRFFTLQRWLAFIFAASPFINSDHILRGYNQAKDNIDPNNIQLENTQNALMKFCVLYFP